MITFEHVTKRYGPAHEVLADLNFRVERGEFVVLYGASGGGKSTVLRLAAALETPTSGRICVGDQALGQLKRAALPVFRRSVGWVPQDARLLKDRSVMANVMLPAHVAGFRQAECVQRAQAALGRAGLDAVHIGSKYPSELAGSEQQRVALARALVNRPALLLVDEPTAHLDHDAARTFLELLDHFAASGVTVLMASFDHTRHLPTRARKLHLAHGKIHA